MQRENTCPECRERFTLKTAHRDRLIEGVISDMKAKCCHTGCSWVGKFGNWYKHCEKCNFHPKLIQKWMEQAIAENKTTPLLLRVYEKNPQMAQKLASSMPAVSYEGWAPFTHDESSTPKRFKADRN